MLEKPVIHYEKVVGAEGVAEIFGCSKAFAYQLMRRKDFPSFKVGRTWKASVSGIDKWIDEQSKVGII